MKFYATECIKGMLKSVRNLANVTKRGFVVRLCALLAKNRTKITHEGDVSVSLSVCLSARTFHLTKLIYPNFGKLPTYCYQIETLVLEVYSEICWADFAVFHIGLSISYAEGETTRLSARKVAVCSRNWHVT
jgi:hypothetical protein